MVRKAILAAIAVMLMGSTGAWALDRDTQGTEGQGKAGAMHGRGGPGGMVGMPDLTAEQKARLKAIGEAQQAEAKPLHDQAKALIKELRALVDGKAGDTKISAKLAEIKTVREANQALMKKYMEQREAVLTPAQRAQMALSMGPRGGGKGEKGGMKCGKGEAPAAKE